MIISKFTQIKKYLPAIAIKQDIVTLDDIFVSAEEQLVEDILGADLYAQLEKKEDQDKTLTVMCERVISLSGFLQAIPEMDLVLTQSGFAVHDSDGLAPASPARVKALKEATLLRLDSSIDTLIRFLLKSSDYETLWRNSEAFEKITAGLVPTFTDFKDYAAFSPAVASVYPQSYSEFKKLYSALNAAIISEVAPYLSQEYCDELIEKYRDDEIITLYEKYVLRLIRQGICSFVLGDTSNSRMYISKARSYMLKEPDAFPTFITSEQSKALVASSDDTAIFSAL